MLNKEKIKAVFFDFDDTLGNREAYAYECYKAILKENTDIEDEMLFETVLQDCMMWDMKGNDQKTFVQQRLKEKYQIVLPYADFNTYWDDHLWEYSILNEDALDVLAYLKEKYTLGVITNGSSYGQRKKLEHTGLLDWFKEEAITVSNEHPYNKPDPRLFKGAMDALHVLPEESVYVGDIFSNDVWGAYQAGMVPVWMWNWGSRKCPADIIVIHHLKELKDML